jgi:hypothetical protein
MAVLVEAAFILPLLASATSLLFHAFNNSMAPFVTEVSSLDFAGPQVIPVLIFALARSAPVPQTIFEGAAFVKLTLVLPLFAFVTLFHFLPTF